MSDETTGEEGTSDEAKPRLDALIEAILKAREQGEPLTLTTQSLNDLVRLTQTARRVEIDDLDLLLRTAKELAESTEELADFRKATLSVAERMSHDMGWPERLGESAWTPPPPELLYVSPSDKKSQPAKDFFDALDMEVARMSGQLDETQQLIMLYVDPAGAQTIVTDVTYQEPDLIIIRGEDRSVIANVNSLQLSVFIDRPVKPEERRPIAFHRRELEDGT